MNDEYYLRGKCHAVKQTDDDYFVGLKVNRDDVKIFFPIGYDIPNDEMELKIDILNLLNIIYDLKDDSKENVSIKSFKSEDHVKFPFNAYVYIINDFMENGYYIEKESLYKTKGNGKINWSKTIKSQKPLLQNNDENSFSPVYTSFIVKQSNLNENIEITHIHQHCVYESFQKLGWLFTTFVPQKPEIKFNQKKFLTILRTKLYNTNNDSKKRLFKSMMDILLFIGNRDADDFLVFGTDRFEYIWEKLIDDVFGIKDKTIFFPRAKWKLNECNEKTTYPLQPDTIMIHENNIYVIDAKYYKYGITKNPKDLPNSSSINKQITYGEYIQEKFDEFKNSIFNVFLMPYNMNDDLFDSNGAFFNMGVAISEWKSNIDKFEYIQGILVDIRYLMHCYNKHSKRDMRNLADFIEKSYSKNVEL